VLVKSCAVPADGASSEELADLGVVDPSFPEFARRGCFASFVLNCTQPARLRQLLLEWNPATAA
jgi:hypothetical protein